MALSEATVNKGESGKYIVGKKRPKVKKQFFTVAECQNCAIMKDEQIFFVVFPPKDIIKQFKLFNEAFAFCGRCSKDDELGAEEQFYKYLRNLAD